MLFNFQGINCLSSVVGSDLTTTFPILKLWISLAPASLAPNPLPTRLRLKERSARTRLMDTLSFVGVGLTTVTIPMNAMSTIQTPIRGYLMEKG